MDHIGDDVRERGDVIPAELFVHWHIYGKWAFTCNLEPRLEPAEPDVVEGGIPSAHRLDELLPHRWLRSDAL